MVDEVSLTYRGSHAGLIPGLQQGVKHSVVFSPRVAGVSWLTPQVGLLIATLLDFTIEILQRVLTVWLNKHKHPETQLSHIHTIIRLYTWESTSFNERNALWIVFFSRCIKRTLKILMWWRTVSGLTVLKAVFRPHRLRHQRSSSSRTACRTS